MGYWKWLYKRNDISFILAGSILLPAIMIFGLSHAPDWGKNVLLSSFIITFFVLIGLACWASHDEYKKDKEE